MSSKTWVYNSSGQSIIIDSEDAEQYLNDGWSYTPSVFVEPTEQNTDENNGDGE